MLQVFPNGSNLLLGDLRNHLQLPLFPTSHDPRRRSSLDAFQSAGMGDHHTFHIFDDVAAAADGQLLRQSAQHIADLCPAVSNGNRLRAAHGRHQLFRQDI